MKQTIIINQIRNIRSIHFNNL